MLHCNTQNFHNFIKIAQIWAELQSIQRWILIYPHNSTLLYKIKAKLKQKSLGFNYFSEDSWKIKIASAKPFLNQSNLVHPALILYLSQQFNLALSEFSRIWPKSRLGQPFYRVNPMGTMWLLIWTTKQKGVNLPQRCWCISSGLNYSNLYVYLTYNHYCITGIMILSINKWRIHDIQWKLVFIQERKHKHNHYIAIIILSV
jgi:hypothetical protein